jgi:hypothetical protein
LLLNFVDTRRFLPRSPLPAKPVRALAFSNYDTHLPALVESCRRAGLKLDTAGTGAGNPVDRPELILGNYDIIFAKGKSALEAMVVGTAVILCDFAGLGPMVTSKEFEELRPLNFGFQALREPLQPENILRQVARYNPEDATRVRDLVRGQAGLDRATEAFVEIYRDVIDEQRRLPAAEINDFPVIGRLRERMLQGSLSVWLSLNTRQRACLRKFPALFSFLKKSTGP